MASEKIRVQLEMTKAEYDQLQEFVDNGTFSSKADAIRRAVRFLLASREKEILFRNSDGTIENVFWL